MLSITSSQPVAWPSTSAVSVAPVSAVNTVTPVQPSARDSKAGLGQDRERAAPEAARRGAPQTSEAAKERSASDAAPLLPRESPDSPDGEASAEVTDAQNKAEREKAEQQVADKALKQQLQDVISNIWKASAAVVDVVLNRELSAESAAQTGQPVAGVSEAAAAVAAAPATTPGAMAVAGLGPAPLLGSGAVAANEVFESRSAQDVVAYDAHGNSSWAPLEAGSLISRRV